MNTNTLSFYTPDMGTADFQAVNGEVKIEYEGTHPEYGEVVLEVTHKHEGVVLSLRDAETREALAGGWQETNDLIGLIDDSSRDADSDVVDAVVNRLDEEGVTLHSFVQEIKSNEAAAINNSGLDAQVRFLVDLFGVAGFLDSAGLGEAIAYDDAEYVIVLGQPNDEVYESGEVYDLVEFIRAYEQAFTDSDSGFYPRLEEALDDLSDRGYYLHVV